MNTATPGLLDCERQFVGCLLCLPHHHTRTVLAGMRADDLADPHAALTLQLVIELAAAGHTATPATVFAHACTTGRAPGEWRRTRLATWLADTHSAIHLPAPDHAAHLKTLVLENAWRRAVAAHAHRLLQAARTSPTELLAELADDTTDIDQLWHRYETARTTAVTPARFEEAAA